MTYATVNTVANIANGLIVYLELLMFILCFFFRL